MFRGDAIRTFGPAYTDKLGTMQRECSIGLDQPWLFLLPVSSTQQTCHRSFIIGRPILADYNARGTPLTARMRIYEHCPGYTEADAIACLIRKVSDITAV